MKLNNIVISIIILLNSILSLQKTSRLHNTIRNCTLRILLKNDIRKTKQIINKIYDKTMAVYYDTIQRYNNLSDDDKYLVETIASMIL